ncbi:hypothetical protein [Brevibacillus fulvus]|uniref:Heme/copper-type cytochrome/quinol oxidase subunit 4 n=1 Tax=Brevibacillus fulvus TaxID=1125967 RepID=A0A938Y0D1_9BACL|nr:hypothetical protein [Brevibacillus fulvus]MBM7588820.1 heme/copper-type cytochrome/quinol oxidase subunit 4 [Brevibacillus fulvus]
MSTAPYIVIFAILCLIGLVGTLWIGRNPVEADYGKKTKKRYTNMMIIYALAAIISLLTLLYFVL